MNTKMATKMVTDRLRSSQVVERSAVLFGPRAADLLESLLAIGLGPGEPPVDMRQITRLLGTALVRRRETLVEADKAHGQQLLRDFQWRQRRDRLVAELNDRINEARRALDATYGVGAAATQTGIAQAPNREPIALMRQADTMLDELRQPSTLAAGAEPLPGITLDRPTWIERIEAAKQALTDALAELVDVRRHTVLASATKDRALADYDTTFNQVSRLLEAVFAAAGMAKEADRVRPSTRRPGRTAEDPGDSLPPTEGSVEPEGEGFPELPTTTPSGAPPVTGAPS